MIKVFNHKTPREVVVYVFTLRFYVINARVIRTVISSPLVIQVEVIFPAKILTS